MAAPKAGRFEWIAPWEEVRALLEPSVLGLRPDARALDLGCGTSTLALELSRVPGIGSVVGLDREPGCIEHMRSTHGEPPGVRWVAGDILSPGADALIPSTCLDLIVDKGTLDCALVRGLPPDYRPPPAPHHVAPPSRRPRTLRPLCFALSGAFSTPAASMPSFHSGRASC